MDKGLRKKAPALLFAVVMSVMMLFGSVVPALAAGEDATVDYAEGVTGTSTENGEIKLRWMEDEGVFGYLIYRTEDAEGDYSPLILVYTNEYVDKSAEVGKTYYYKVRAVDKNFVVQDTDKFVEVESGNTESVMIAHAMLMPRALPFPSGEIKATGISYNQINLEFNHVEGAEGYSIARSLSIDGAYVEVGVIDNPAPVNGVIKYEDKNDLKEDTSYYYTIATIENGELGEYRDLPVAARTLKKGSGLDTPVLSISKDDDTTFRLTWPPVDDATGYRIYRAQDSTDDAAFSYFRYSTGSPNVDNTAKDLNSTYYYYIIAESAAGIDSDKSNIVNASTPGPGIPAPVISVSLKPNEDTTVVVTWPAVPEADTYQVYRKESATDAYEPVGGPISETRFEDPDKTPSSTYWYTVVAIGDAGQSEPSNEEHITIPDGLQPTVMERAEYLPGTNNVEVEWKLIDKADRYEIQIKAPGAADFITYETVDHPQKTLVFPDLPKGQTYYFRAYVKQGTRTSEVSNEISVKELLPAPMNLVAEGKSTSTILTNWTQVENNYGYSIYRSDNGENGTYRPIKDVGKDVTEYLDTGLEPDTDYWYQVYAIDAEDELGQASNKALGTTWKKTVMNVKVVPYTYCCNKYFGLVVSWTPVEGATTYTVYRSTYDGNYKKVATTRYATYDDMVLPPNTTYWYKIVANTGEEGIGYGTTIGKLFKLTVACDHHYGREIGNTLRWKKQDGVTHYTLYRSLDNREWELITQVPGTTERYIDKPVSPRTDYYYRILGSNGQIEQTYTKTCGQSLSLNVSSQVGTMVLKWKEISNANSYSILRSTDGKVFKQVDKVGALYTTWTDTTPMTYRQRYYYKVISDNHVEDVDYAIAR